MKLTINDFINIAGVLSLSDEDFSKEVKPMAKMLLAEYVSSGEEERKDFFGRCRKQAYTTN